MQIYQSMKILGKTSQNQLPASLQVSLWDVAFYSLMVGLGETYLSAFVLTMGFSERASGLLITLPTLIGSVIQLLSALCVRLFGSQRKWVMISASIQATSLLGLSALGLGLPLSDVAKERAVFGLITAYWTFGLAAGPSWSSWIGSIVPDHCRTHFFAYRTRVAQLFTVVGLIVAGLALETRGPGELKLPIFALLFAVSALCRYISVGFLKQHPEGMIKPSIDARNLLKPDFWRWLAARRTFTIIVFLFVTQIATNVSGPFFNAYMLKHLALDYEHYVALVSIAFATRVLSGGALQRLAHRLGSTTLTHLGAFLIVPIPALWVLTDSFGWLLLFQALTGFAWGCHELGVTLLYMEKQSHHERAGLMTITQLLNASAMFLGSWIGFLMLGSGPTQAFSYYSIFIASSCLRLLPIFALPLLGDSRIRFPGRVTQVILMPFRFFAR